MELYEHYASECGNENASGNIKPSIKLILNQSNLNLNLKNLYMTNYETLNKKITNINVGGDHSMGISSVGASLNVFKNKTKVIWIDAHADINTRASSPSGNVHGMPLSFITGLDKSFDYPWIQNTLEFQNLCYIGIRDLDPEEINIIKTHNIKTISVREFNSNTTQVIKNLVSWVGTNPVHISFDVDSLDPSFIQYTGTRVPDGLDYNMVIKFIGMFCKLTNVVNVDISELNLYNPDCENMEPLEKMKSFECFNQILNSFYSSMTKK